MVRAVAPAVTEVGAPSWVDGVAMPLDGDLLLSGTFERDGLDLVVRGDDGSSLTISGYFAAMPPADLVTAAGETVPGEVVAALAGPPAPVQYAQADATPGGAEPIGTVQGLGGSVTATRIDGTTVELQAGQPVFQGDVIETASGAMVELVFIDGTRFTLSADARMALDEVVYDPDAGIGAFLTSVIRGAFVFITGQVAGTSPDAMEVTTPAGVLGVRGTRVGCSIDAVDGATTCALLVSPEGEVGAFTFINQSGSVLVSQPFETVSAAAFGATPATEQLTQEQVRNLLSGRLGDFDLDDVGLVQKTGGATFDIPAFGVPGGATGFIAPLGPQDPVAGPDDVVLEGPIDLPFLLEFEPEPEIPPPPPPPPTDIQTGQPVTAAPLAVVTVDQDFGDVEAFPVLVDGGNVFLSPTFAELGLAVFGDPASLTLFNGAPAASITIMNEGGDFQNTLGAYVVGTDGRIGPPELVFANASVQGGGGDLIPGVSMVRLDNQGRGFAPGTTLSLFVLADGFGLNPVLQQPDLDGFTLRFEEVTPGGLFAGVPDVGDDGLRLIAVAPDGSEVVLEGSLFHTVAHFQGVPIGGELVSASGLNDDMPTSSVIPLDDDGDPINQHNLAGLSDTGSLRLGFEDLPLDRADQDFQDLVIDIAVEPAAMPAAPPQALTFGFDLDNQAGALSLLQFSILRPEPGDRLIMVGPFTLADGGEVLQDGAPTGIVLAQTEPTSVTLTAGDPVAIQTFEDVLNAIGFATDLDDPTSGTRILELMVADPNGIESTVQVNFVVPGPPLFGTSADDVLDGTAGNDAIFGLDGDDQVRGGGGDDILVGGAGSDVVSAGGGVDFVRIDRLSEVDADGDGVVDFVDQVLDFDAGEGDRLDISGLLEDLGAGRGDAGSVVDVAAAADGAVEVRVDLDGAGNGDAGFQTLVRLVGTGGVAEVEGALIVAA